MQVRAIEIAALLGGMVEGDSDIVVHKPAKIEEGEAGAISFFANPKYEEYVYSCKSSILLVSRNFKPREELPMTLIRVDDVYASLSVLMEHFGNLMEDDTDENELISAEAFIHPNAKVSETAKIEAFAYIGPEAIIGEAVHIYPQVYIGAEVEIGDNSILYPGTRVYKGCKIGQNCILQSNAIIGSDGFGFAPQEDGSFKKIPQLGIVELGNGVEVGANTVIDRATMGATVIENGVKLDNLIQIAHNVRIGANTVIAAQAGIAGSTKLGENCMIGGQVGLVGHIEIAKGTKIQAQSGINKSVKKENTALFGSPAMDYKDFLRSHAIFKQLPKLLKRLDQLEKEVKNNK